MLSAVCSDSLGGDVKILCQRIGGYSRKGEYGCRSKVELG